jgi:sugar phosphate isomerase/epimerase
MNIAGHDIAVCSWSLRPADMADLVAQVRQLGLEHVQLALGPLLPMPGDRRNRELATLRDAGIKITAGMMAFDGEDYSSIAAIRQTGGYVSTGNWPDRRAQTLAAGKLAAELGLKLLTVHIGFVPHAGDANYGQMLARMRDLAGALAELGIELTMETGQEPAAELRKFIVELGAGNVYVNFDPANMILYGCGNPIEAIPILGRHIRHVHVKDATASAEPGKTWGAEVPFGTGQVGAKAFIAALKSVGYTGPLAIEREAGEQRLADARTAIAALRGAMIG